MKTYQIDISPQGMGATGLILFTLAFLSEIVIYIYLGFISFFIGFIMFMAGGLFGRSIQRHYDKNICKDMVGVPHNKHSVFWYRKLVVTLFPLWWVMAGLWHHGSGGIIGFSCLHLTGGECWW